MGNALNLDQRRILELLKKQGFTQGAISKILGIPQSAVSNMYHGKRELRLTEAAPLLDLLDGKSPTKEIPVIGIAGAGNWLEAIEHTDEWITTPDVIEGNARFAVRVSGDSMNLMLPEGSYAIIDPEQRQLFVGKLYLLLNKEGEATLKRYRADPARFEPVSDNPDHIAFELGIMPFEVVGRVIGALQKF